jgi:hypothetical protein
VGALVRGPAVSWGEGNVYGEGIMNGLGKPARSLIQDRALAWMDSCQEAFILVSMSIPETLPKILAPAVAALRAALKSRFISQSAYNRTCWLPQVLAG